MTIYVFIIESANTEDREQIFENGEVVDLTEPIFIENLPLDGIEDMIEKVEDKFNDSAVVTFIDKQYQCEYYNTELGKAEFEYIKNFKENPGVINFCNCDWYDFLYEVDDIFYENTYIFVTSNSYKNCYDMANFIQRPLLNNCYFNWSIKSLDDVVKSKSYYNIFSNIPRIKQINSIGERVFEDKESIEWIIEYGVSQVKGLINAGALQLEKYPQKKVDEWTLNPYSYFSIGIITQFNLKPKPAVGEKSRIMTGLTILEQFNEDAQYRYTITDLICRCLCKYGLEFGKINTINYNPHTVNFDFLLSS
jgi:hypothetical protein